jgi:hypothetical protein
VLDGWYSDELTGDGLENDQHFMIRERELHAGKPGKDFFIGCLLSTSPHN